MARRARLGSDSGVYHAMLRGVNKQLIFEDDEDCLYFISLLERYKDETEFKLYTYCLMGNHVHLLIKTGKYPIGRTILRIEAAYVYYFNHKYERVGPLFTGRVRTVPIETPERFLGAMRYILCNPIPAGLCDDPALYPWSNFPAFSGVKDFTDAADILTSFSTYNDFLTYIHALSDSNTAEEEAIEYPVFSPPRITDLRAKEIISEVAGCHNATQFQALSPMQQNSLIPILKKRGISIRQLSRLTGISKSKIGRL